MIAWILGIIFLLVISLFLGDEAIEPYASPTVVPTKVRSDLTCSDPDSSVLFDRFDKADMELLASNAPFPVNLRNDSLGGSIIHSFSGQYFNFGRIRDRLKNVCIGETNIHASDYEKKRGNKVFIETDKRALDGDYNLVDIYCCKGELYQPTGTNSLNERVCLPFCPPDYTKNDVDPTICIRNDSTCTYTSDLSANIQNNWYKTCAALYRQNINITSTINSISNVVSTFTDYTNNVKNNYDSLLTQLDGYNTVSSRRTNYINNFNIITTEHNKVNSIQTTIIGKYNSLQADKVRFDTLFNNLGCSNYM